MKLPTQTSGLVQLAAAAKEKAYAPYSRFKVGAAVLCSSGIVYTGCNVENVSYGLTICAERVAVAKAASEGEREIVAVAVAVDGEPAMPCGACRQVIREFAKDDTSIIAAGSGGKSVTKTLGELLPEAFTTLKPEEQ